jgi:hypothetical protein
MERDTTRDPRRPVWEYEQRSKINKEDAFMAINPSLLSSLIFEASSVEESLYAWVWFSTRMPMNGWTGSVSLNGSCLPAARADRGG